MHFISIDVGTVEPPITGTLH